MTEPSDSRDAATPLRAAMFGVDVVAELEKEGGDAIGAAVREVGSDDVEIVTFGPTGEVNAEGRGAEGFLAVWRDWTASFDRFEIESVGDPLANGDAIVVPVRQRGWIGGNEIPAEGFAVGFSHGEVLVRIEFHLDRERALRAAGIEPPG